MAKKDAKSAKRAPGLDPHWHEADMDFTIFAVLAPCEKVADAYRRAADDTEGLPVDCLNQAVKVAGDDWERAIFVYQLKGSPWTHVQPLANRVGWATAEELSKTLRTKLLVYMYQGTIGGFGYELFENGSSVEEYFSGELMEDRGEKIAGGWQLSDDGGLQLRSKRLSQIDMNSPEASQLPDQIARDLDIYIPGEAWTINPESGLAGLVEPWSKDDIQEAKVLLAKW